MPIEKFIPTSPDEAIIADSDLTTARFGHLNVLVNALNAGFIQRAENISASSMGALIINGESSNILISKDYITNRGGTGDSSNTAYGENSLRDHDSGQSNVSIGYNSMTTTVGATSSVAVGRAPLYFAETVNDTVAIGTEVLVVAPSSIGNTVIGCKAMQLSNPAGPYNTIIGDHALRYDEGENNSVLGAYTSANDTSGSVILGKNASADADNQFVVGSSSVNAGSVTTETNTSTKVWNVKINGVNHKILLA